MRDALGPGTWLGYCTNVHAGATLDDLKHSLDSCTLAVKRQACPDGLMGIGLWLSCRAVEALGERRAANGFRDFLQERGLVPFTFNGFPYGDFHGRTVKRQVYHPNWASEERLTYTMRLADLMAVLLDDEREGSISTLPLGWREDLLSWPKHDAVMKHLLAVVEHLAQLEDRTGCCIHVDVEPEPGCCLDLSDDVVRLFEALDRGTDDGERLRRHLRVCHDVCHAAVMFEEQQSMIARYRAEGIRVGKVQLSNAVRVDLRRRSDIERHLALTQLRSFAEDRYLHQTSTLDGDGIAMVEDLPDALAEFDATDRAGDEWRVHFHVPVFLEELGLLGTTRHEIDECLHLLGPDEVRHWEVETYAWNVLPEELRAGNLTEGIARELEWVRERAAAVHGPKEPTA